MHLKSHKDYNIMYYEISKQLPLCWASHTQLTQWGKIYIYIDKDGNPSKKSTRHVDANVNTQKENQNHENNNNEVENVMYKCILCHKSINDKGALIGMCGRSEEFGLSMVAH